jgi:carboxyl-terminal processing protease
MEKEEKKEGAGFDNFSGYIAAFLIGAGLAAGCCWYFMDYSQRDIIQTGKEFVAIKECRDILEKNAGISEDKPVENAVNAYVKHIAMDKYTYYYEEDDTFDATSFVNTSGTALASGFQIDKADDGNIIFTEVTTGMPAYEQGIRQDDEVVSINGVNVADEGYEKIAEKLMGKEGTSADLVLLRDGKEMKLTFIRANETMINIEYNDIGDIAYIRIKRFDVFTEGKFSKEIEKYTSKNKIIFDLRSNPGGDILASTGMAAKCFGHCVTYEKWFDGHVEEHELTGKNLCEGKDVVLLINEKTASSSELFSACMIQEINPTVVGVNSFGKGIFQVNSQLSNGGYLHYTAGYVSSGEWESVQGKGIAPDIEVPMDRELIGTDKDVQLKKAIDILD